MMQPESFAAPSVFTLWPPTLYVSNYTDFGWEDAVHPMLRENPLSGQQTLFVAPAYVRGVEAPWTFRLPKLYTSDRRSS